MSQRWAIDPDDPRAPPQEVWDQLDEQARREVVASLPSSIPRAGPPEGDEHTEPKERSKLTLREFFRRRGRSVYLASELAAYYPGESHFAPDLIAILDVPDHARQKWVVSDEGRGLDFTLEIHVRGDRHKDYVTNVERYARLGIPEYFLFDPPKQRLLGYRRSPASGAYEPVVPQGGLYRSDVLDLDLSLDGGRLQFSPPGGGALLDPMEWIDKLRTMVDAATRRAVEEGKRAEEEARRAEETSQRLERYAAKLRELGIDPEDL